MSEPKYHDITVQLSGEDGNGFFIMARVANALKRHGVGGDEIAHFRADAMIGDYDNLLRTCMAWVDCQ